MDWIEAGGTKEEFEQLIPTAPKWKPYGLPRKQDKDQAFETERASAIEMRPVEWTWKNRIAHRKVNVFFGPAETGKSTLTYYIMCQEYAWRRMAGATVQPPRRQMDHSPPPKTDWGDYDCPATGSANGADLD